MRSYWSVLPVENGERNFSVVTLPELKDFMRRPTKKYILPDSYIGRFDLASYDIYGTSHYWWALLAANDILDPFDYSLVGRVLVCPDEMDIQEYLLHIRKVGGR